MSRPVYRDGRFVGMGRLAEGEEERLEEAEGEAAEHLVDRLEELRVLGLRRPQPAPPDEGEDE